MIGAPVGGAAPAVIDEVAAAVADEVRRRILVMLRDGPMPAGEIAERFAISRPAVSRHLRVLRQAGLVRDSVTGRQRHYELDVRALTALSGWLAQFLRPAPQAGGGPAGGGQAGGWRHRLDALETEVYRTRRERRPPGGQDQREDLTA